MANRTSKPVKKSQGKKMNTKWLNNVMKSIGSASIEQFTELAPNISSTVKGVNDSIKDLRSLTKGNSVGRVGSNLANNKYVGVAKKAFSNALDDLKTGNFNNTKREEQAIADSFGFDDFNLDEDDGGGAVTFNYIDEDNGSSDDATVAVTNSIQKSAEANVKAQKATTDAMISVASASMLQSQEIGKEINTHLGNINNNISALLTYHQENTTKFYEAATAVFDRFAKKEEESEKKDYHKTSSLFNSTGGLNVNNYKNYVKKQITSAFKGTQLGNVADMIFSDDDALEMMASNPLGFATKGIIAGIVPNMVTTTIKGVEEAFSGFMPTMISKLTEFRNNEEKGMMGAFKRFIGKAFGIRVTKNNEFDLDNKVNKDEAVFDGVVRNTLIEVIPKHLREMSSYLRDIAKHFNVDVDKSKGNAEVFDAKKSRFITIDQLQKEIAKSIGESVTDSMSNSKFGRAIAEGGNELVGNDSKTFQRMMNQMFEFMARENGTFSLDEFDTSNKKSKISKILNMIDTNHKGDEKILEVLRKTIDLLKENQVGLHHAELARIRAVEARNERIGELEENYDIENLIAAGYSSDTDIEDEIDRVMGNKKVMDAKKKAKERAKQEEKFKRKREYKHRKKGNAEKIAKEGLIRNNTIPDSQTRRGRNEIVANNIDASSIPGLIANTGQHLKGFMFSAMNGDSKEAIAQLGGIFTDGIKTFWGSIKDNFLSPLKESIFGKKNEEGYVESGLFSGVRNHAVDIWSEVKSKISGKNWKDSNGEIHEVDPKDSVVGKVKGLFTTLSDSIKFRLFGNKDPKDAGKEGIEKGKGAVHSIIDSFKEGLTGWKDALFGSDPEKDKEELKKETKEKIMNAIPDMGAGGLAGLAVSHFSGGLLGMAVTGPVGVIAGMGGSLLLRSNKFQDYLFGPEVEDEDGNKSRVGGLISKKTQDMFKDPDMKKNAIGGAALGFAKSAILGSGGGVMGMLVGGPIAGAMMGMGMGILKKSKMYQEFMFGKTDENGNVIQEGFKSKLKKSIKGIFGNNNESEEEKKDGKKIAGMAAIGAAGGGIMGLLMGGPIVGATVGLAAGIKASGNKFKKWMFGEKDENGNKTKEGFVGKVGNFLHVEVMAPMRSKILNIADDFKSFMKFKVFEKVGTIFDPLSNVIKEKVDEWKSKGKDFVGTIVGKFVKPFGRLANKVIFQPLKKTVSVMTSLAWKATKSAISLPVKMLVGITKTITSPFVKVAKKVASFPFKLMGWIGKKTLNLTTKLFGKVGGIFKFVGEKVGNVVSGAIDKVADKRNTVSKGINWVRKKITKDGWRSKLKESDIKYNEAKLTNRQKAKRNASIDKNRALVASTLGYDVKYFTEKTLDAAIAKDPKLKRRLKKFEGQIHFEDDPEEVARKKRKELNKKSDAEIISMDGKESDIETRSLIQETRQTSLLERLVEYFTGRKSKFSDEYGDQTEDGASKDNNTGEEKEKNKKDDNEDATIDNNENTIEDEINKIAGETYNDIIEAGGLGNWAKGGIKNIGKSIRGIFSKDTVTDGFNNSDLGRLVNGVFGDRDKNNRSSIDINAFRRWMNNDTPDQLENNLMDQIESFMEDEDKTRAKGGNVEKDNAYLVGDGGTDPSAREIFIPNTNGKILSQKDGGIKVFIQGISDKVKGTIQNGIESGMSGIQSLKTKVTSLFSQNESDNQDDLDEGNDDIAKAMTNANAEPDYDENGNIIKETASKIGIDSIKDPEDKKDAIQKADDAADLANAKNAGSYLSQQKKKEAQKEDEKENNKLNAIKDMVNEQRKGNKENKEHHNIWSSIFSKKGLITMGLVALITKFPGILEGAIGIIKNIGEIVGPTLGKIIDQFNTTEKDHTRTNGNSITEEAERKIDQFKDGNILLLQEDGGASASTNAIERTIGRTALNYRNRYNKGIIDHIPLANKFKKREKRLFRGVDKVIHAPGKIIDYVKNGKPSEYKKLTRDINANNGYYAKSTGQYFDKYNREILSVDEWNELIKDKDASWIAENKKNYYVPDDSSFDKKPKRGERGKASTFGEKATKASDTADNVTKSAAKNVDDVAEGATKAATKNADNAASSIGKSLGKNADDIAKGLGTAGDDIAKGAGKLIDNAASNDKVFKQTSNIVTEFFQSLKDKLGKKLGKSASKVGKAFGKIGPKSIMKCLQKVWDKAVIKIAALLGGRITVDAVSAGLGEAVFAIGGFIDGVTGASKLFKVRKEDTDATMVLIAGVLGAFNGTTPGSLIDLICSIIGPIIGVDVYNALATSIYNWIKGEKSEDVKNLKANQEKFHDDYMDYQDKELKKQYDTQMKAGILDKNVTFEEFKQGVYDGIYSASYKSEDDYNVDVNGSIMDKATGAIGKGFNNTTHWLGNTLISKDKKQDKNGNIYTKNANGTWQVTNASGQDLGSVESGAIPKDAKDVSEKGILTKLDDATNNVVSNAGKVAWSGIKKVGGGIADAAGTIDKATGGALSSAAGTVGGAVKDAAGTAVSTLSNQVKGLGSTLGNTITDLVEGGRGAWDSLKKGDIGGVAKNVWKATGGNLYNTAKGVVTSTYDSVKVAFNGVKDGLGNLGTNIKNTISKGIDGFKNNFNTITTSKVSILRNPEDNTYYRMEKGKFYHYNTNDERISDTEYESEEIMNLYKSGLLIKDEIEVKGFEAVKENIKKVNKKLTDVGKKGLSKVAGFFGKIGKGISSLWTKKEDSAKKASDALTKGATAGVQAITNAKKIIVNKTPEEEKYVYYDIKDKSYYLCMNGKWYHFNGNGQKISESEVMFTFIDAKFKAGDLVRDKATKSINSNNEKEISQYLKSLKSDKTTWDKTKKEKEDKDKKKKNSKKSTSNKVWMSPDGDYYIKKKDGSYDHYNASGWIIDKNINDEESVAKIKKKIKNGTLVETTKPSGKKFVTNSDVENAKKTVQEVRKSIWTPANTVSNTLNAGANAALAAMKSIGLGGNGEEDSNSSTTDLFSKISSLISDFSKNALTGLLTGKWTNNKSTNTQTTTDPASAGANVALAAMQGDEEIGGNGDEVNGFTYYSQKDKRWNKKDYSSGNNNSTMGKAGCAPTAMSMVASELTGKDIKPTDIAKDAVNSGYRDETGTNSKFIPYESEKLNLSSEENDNPTPEYISSELDKGKPIILNGINKSGKDSAYTKSGHYVVAVGKDKNGNVLINDPRGKSKSKSISLNKLMKETRASWSFDKTNETGGYGENLFTAEDVIKVAEAEVGYSEKASSKDLDKKKANPGSGNYTKFAKYVGHTNGLAWCATFVTYCFYKAANGDKKHATSVLCGANTAACATNVSAFKRAKRYDMKPQPGDVVFFMNGSSHTGLVVAVNGDTITTIEGNTSPGKFNRDGGCVAKKTYNYKKESRISGFGHPKYDGESNYQASGDISSEAETGATITKDNSSTETTGLDGIGTKFDEYKTKALNGLLTGKWEEMETTSTDTNTSDSSTTDSSSEDTSNTSIETSGKSGGNYKKGGKAGKSGLFNNLKTTNDKARAIWDYLKSAGYEDGAAAGILGNIQQESNFNEKSNKDNNSTKYKGLFQLDVGKGGRFTNSQKWNKKNGYDPWSVEGQTRFALEEMAHKNVRSYQFKHYTGIEKSKYPQITDPKQAAHVWVAGYEGAITGGDKGLKTQWQQDDKRQNYAKKWYDKFKGTGGKGGFGGFGEEENNDFDIFTNTYFKTNNTRLSTPIIGEKDNSNNSLFKYIIEQRTNEIKGKNSSSSETDEYMKKIISLLESLVETGTNSVDELKNISRNSKKNQGMTNIITGGNTNNIQTTNSNINNTPKESRNSILAKQLARG